MFRTFRLVSVLAFLLFAPSASADVVVLANRTISKVTVEILHDSGLPDTLTIAPGDSLPVFFQGNLQVRFGDGLVKQQFNLRKNTAYFLARHFEDESLYLEQIGLGEQALPEGQPSQKTRSQISRNQKATQPAVITVKLLVDDDQPTHRQIWEDKLRKRIAKASQILERQAGVQLKVVEVATWETDDRQHDFNQTLRKFERTVRPSPAQLAIGFSSQYQAVRGRTHLGVTRWPLHTHILLRERSRGLQEAELLELLVHELGHYLGATHSPEPQSVMRPLLTRGAQRRVGARIQFDPVNALLVAMTGEEIRNRGVRHLSQLSESTTMRMKQIYGVLVRAMPEDPAAAQQIKLINRIADLRKRKSTQKTTKVVSKEKVVAPLVRDTQAILGQLLKVAQQQKESGEEIPSDELTNLYVRRAAQAALRLRPANAKRAMLLALGIFMDDTGTLRNFPGPASFIQRVESEEQRELRIEAMGMPTMRERTDLTKHFFVSAHLVVVGGKEATIKAGLAKETLDSQGGSGFSFVDMAANQAGVTFAEHLLAEKLALRDLAQEFHVDDYLPTLVGLEEGLTAASLSEQYGGENQLTVTEQLEDIQQRVLNLSIYDQPSANTEQ